MARQPVQYRACKKKKDSLPRAATSWPLQTLRIARTRSSGGWVYRIAIEETGSALSVALDHAINAAVRETIRTSITHLNGLKHAGIEINRKCAPSGRVRSQSI